MLIQDQFGIFRVQTSTIPQNQFLALDFFCRFLQQDCSKKTFIIQVIITMVEIFHFCPNIMRLFCKERLKSNTVNSHSCAWVYYRGSPDSTNFGFHESRVIRETVLIEDLFSTTAHKIGKFDFQSPPFTFFLVKALVILFKNQYLNTIGSKCQYFWPLTTKEWLN